MPTKQYVNLDPSKPHELNGLDKKRAGKKVTLEATINPAKKNVKVTFKITYGDNNLENPGKVKTKTASTDENGKAKVTFTASAVGGQEYKVAAFVKKTDEALESDTYVTWRRIYYQMSRMDAVNRGAGRNGGPIPAAAALDLANVSAEYEGHFIELVDDTPMGADLVQHPTVACDEAEGVALLQLAQQGYDKKREPVAMKFVVVNQLATSKTEELTRTVDSDVGLFMLANTPWIEESLPVNDDWCLSADYQVGGAGPWTPFPKNALSLAGRTSKTVNVDLSGLPGAPASVALRIRYRYLSSESNGVSLYNAVFVANGSMNGVAPTTAEKEQTAVHEIGHFIGMVPKGQSSHYKEHGHKGPHCWTGLTVPQRQQADYLAADLTGTCVMYGSNGATRQGSFCAACQPSVRKSAVRITTSIA